MDEIRICWGTEVNIVEFKGIFLSICLLIPSMDIIIELSFISNFGTEASFTSTIGEVKESRASSMSFQVGKRT